MSLMAETVVLPVQDAYVWLSDHLGRIFKLGQPQFYNCGYVSVFQEMRWYKCYFHQSDAALSDHDIESSRCIVCFPSFAKDMVLHEFSFKGIRSIEDAHEVAKAYRSMVTFRYDHLIASARIVDYKIEKYYGYLGRDEGYKVVPISFMCSRTTPIALINNINRAYKAVESHPIDIDEFLVGE